MGFHISDGMEPEVSLPCSYRAWTWLLYAPTLMSRVMYMFPHIKNVVYTARIDNTIRASPDVSIARSPCALNGYHSKQLVPLVWFCTGRELAQDSNDIFLLLTSHSVPPPTTPVIPLTHEKAPTLGF